MITVGKQNIDSNERHCIVFAEYDGCNDSITIKQEKGHESSYGYTLKFKDENEYAVRSLTTSKPTEFSIPLVSTKNLYINNEYVSSIPYYDLKFVKYDDWYDVFIDEDDNEVSLIVVVKESNESKDFDRETELEIYNANNITNRIRLLIKQPKNRLFKTNYSLFISGDRYFNVDTIKTSKIEFKPQKTDVYENGDKVVSDCLEQGYKIECDWSSSDNDVLDGRDLKLVNFDGTHVMKPIYHGLEVVNEVTLCVHAWIVDENGNYMTDVIDYNICLQGVNKTTYKYIFSYDDKSLYKEIIWGDNELDKRFINVISKKQHFINGIFDCEYEIPFKYKLIDNVDDNVFSVYLKETEDDTRVEKFYISPNFKNYLDDNIVRQYTLYQDENENELKLNLIQLPSSNEKHANIELNVIVHKDDIGNNDYWTDNESILVVTDITDGENHIEIKEIPLNRFWLYEGIDNNCDVIFNGDIDLIVGHKYNFKAKNVIIVNTSHGTVDNANINESYVIDDDDIGLDLMIEI